MRTAKDLFKQLNAQDENVRIEAKTASGIDKAIMKSVCAFANEPGLEGGYLLLGVAPSSGGLFPSYEVVGIDDPDKIQMDLASKCSSQFNKALRPQIEVDELEGETVIVVFIPEEDDSAKPIYFNSQGLPRGAYRRIGSTDQSCTEDDLQVFYQGREGYDSSVLRDASVSDLDPKAIERYRSLRENVNPYAAELEYDDTELLEALGCVKNDEVTVAGLLLFGKRPALRRVMPMIRVDYIRVPGNTWVEDPDQRFTTIDMRGSLLELVNRTVNAVNDDLPKGFLLEEGLLQAESVGLPTKALREAIVNALMHRSYRKNSPIQIIRYNNRIEIVNPGYSLKPEERLGDPGSETRNPHIAAVFHETNLAETKGSGIRAMRKLLEDAGMAPPTFESNRSEDTFTARLLLHHFLSEDDIEWLTQFDAESLSDSQKRALIFLREVGAIDNPTFRQLSDLDVLKASGELRSLRDKKLIQQKGKGRGTYYVPGPHFADDSAPVREDSTPVDKTDSKQSEDHSAPVDQGDSAPVRDDSAPVDSKEELPKEVKAFLDDIGNRATKKQMNLFLLSVCRWKDMKLQEMADLLDREPKYILRKYIQPLMDEGKLQYTIPDMPNHPKQAYTVTDVGMEYLKSEK
ncbi:ATP-binding protein [Fodinibius sp. SL11]|uniref:ATP-binding protein n=1 Tax=Fodinibius sp. SL11 TaxID=3425690 RepID=UPI003F88542A